MGKSCTGLTCCHSSFSATIPVLASYEGQNKSFGHLYFLVKSNIIAVVYFMSAWICIAAHWLSTVFQQLSPIPSWYSSLSLCAHYSSAHHPWSWKSIQLLFFFIPQVSSKTVVKKSTVLSPQHHHTSIDMSSGPTATTSFKYFPVLPYSTTKPPCLLSSVWRTHKTPCQFPSPIHLHFPIMNINC